MLTILTAPPPTLELCENEEKERKRNININDNNDEHKDENNNNKSNKLEKWSKDFYNFLSLCLNKDSQQRASAKDLLNHKWFKNCQTHSYIVENVLKNASQLKIKKNGQVPASLEQKDDISESDPVSDRQHLHSTPRYDNESMDITCMIVVLF